MISTSKTGVLVYGELAKEPEFKRLQNGGYLMKLNVRYDSEKNEQGKWLGKFIDVNVWRIDVDLWSDMLHKGDCIIASGKKVEPHEYNGKTYTNENKGKARKLSSVRAMFKYFYNKEYLPSNVSAKITMPKIKDKEIIKLEANEVSDILNVAENGSSYLTKHQEAYHEVTHIRDTALLTLFLGTGIRISECVGLNVNDIDFNVNGFTITRKGGARVILYFSDEVADALKAYLKERSENKKVPKDEQALFLSMQNKRLSTRAIQNIVQKYSRIVSPLKKISPHKLRSTYGTSLYRETGDIYVVAEVLGHRDVNTTKKHYAAMSDDIRRAAAKKVTLRKDD